jgi:predicted DNA-binding WGR domain protein
MEKKFCLLKNSDGARGANGKKKIYEVTVSGNTVTMTWGMAEKPNRQTKVETFSHPAYAMQAATTKVWEKVSGGYKVAYTV